MRCKLITYVITLFLLFSLIAIVGEVSVRNASAYDGTSGDYQYNLIDNGNAAEIAMYTGLGGNISIPNNMDGTPVTAIGDYAFVLNDNIANLTIPAGVTYIGNYSFNSCSALLHVNLPNSLKGIGDGAFATCHVLANITIPGGITNIGSGVFSECYSITNVVIPSGDTRIAAAEFQSCSSVTNVTIPSSVNNIADSAFQGCQDLNDIAIPGGVTYIGNYTFQGCPLTSVTLPDGITSVQDYTFQYCQLSSVTIPSMVKSIGSGAFNGCPLTSVTIPGSVISIGQRAFLYCNLANVTIPNNVTSIGDWAFGSCPLTSVTIPGKVTSIGSSAFQACSLTSVNISGSVTSIGSQAFCDCPLTSVIIPNNVTSLGDGCFAGCSHLPSVIIPSKITSIGNNLFEQCSVLTSVTLPNNVTSIGNYAFDYCYDLTSIVIPSEVTSIGDYAFANCPMVTVTIPSKVTSIGNYAFNSCTHLTSVTIPNSVTTLGDGAFAYCSALTSVTIPNNVTSMGNYAFQYCTLLSSVNIPSKVTVIGTHAFEYCPALTNVTIPNGVTTIGDWAYNNCIHLTSVTIPGTVTRVGFSLAYCDRLTAITFTGNAPTTVGGSFGYAGAASETVYYHIDATGFTTPTWKGLHCMPLVTTPSAPTGLAATAGNGLVALNWTAPANNGGATIDHYVVYQNGVAVRSLNATASTVTGLTNGLTYVFKVSAHNSAGNGANSTAANGKPVNPISVTIISPSSGSLNRTGSVAVSWRGNGTITHFQVSLDGGNYLDVATAEIHTFGSLSDGQHNVTVKALDAGSNNNTALVTFTVDMTAPSLIITSPTAGYLSTDGSVPVMWTAFDAGSGLAKVEISTDGIVWSQVNGTTRLLDGLADGSNTVHLRAADNAGNVRTATMTFTVDTVAPSLSITSPKAGYWNNTGGVLVVWTDSDSGSGVSRVEISADENAWSTVTGTSDVLSGLSAGTHSIHVRVTDNADHITSAIVTFHVDLTDPVLSINSPTVGYLNNTGSVLVKWTVSDAGSGLANFEISTDGTVWSPVTGTSDLLSVLPEGANTVYIRATDIAGNANTASVAFTVDTVAPSTSIISPSGAINTTSATVQWTTNETGSGLARTEIKVDDTQWNPVSGSSYPLTALTDGSHTVSLRTTDVAGNANTASVVFTVDTVKPIVTLMSPAAGSWLNTSRLNVAWTDSDVGTGMSHFLVSLDGGQWVFMTAEHATFTGLADGEHSIVVRAYDGAGNYNESGLQFHSETVNPTLRFATPSAGARLDLSTVEATWNGSSASGIAGYWVRMDGGAWTSSDLNCLHSFASLADGDHTVDLKAQDNAGNWNTASVSFAVDTVAPTVLQHSPTGNIVPRSTMIVFSFSEKMNESSLSIVMNGVTGVLAWSGDNVTYTPNTVLAYGTNYSVVLAGKDLAGNQVNSTWTFTTLKNAGAIEGVIKDAGGIDLVPGQGSNGIVHCIATQCWGVSDVVTAPREHRGGAVHDDAQRLSVHLLGERKHYHGASGNDVARGRVLEERRSDGVPAGNRGGVPVPGVVLCFQIDGVMRRRPAKRRSGGGQLPN